VPLGLPVASQPRSPETSGEELLPFQTTNAAALIDFEIIYSEISFALRTRTMASMKESWQDVAAAKRAATLASIPSEWLIPEQMVPSDEVLDVTKFPESSGFFTKEELEITAASASGIINQISKKIWSAERVTLAFCKAASVAHQLVSSIQTIRNG
jgi:hypothetical protein